MPTISMLYGILGAILFADWELPVAGEQPFRIAPLQ